MGNCTSGLGIVQNRINLDNSDEVIALCHSILGIDNDLTENEDYFREDTVKLGFKSEAHRIVYDNLNAGYRGKDLIEQIAKVIISQDYFGECELLFEGDSVVFVYGGNKNN
jgi:hypothetical protein